MQFKETVKKIGTAAYEMNAKTVCDGVVKSVKSLSEIGGEEAILDGIIRACEKLKAQQKPAAPKVSFRERLIKMLEKKQGEAV